MSARCANNPQVLRTLLQGAPFHEWNQIVGACVAFAMECIDLERAAAGTYLGNIDLTAMPTTQDVLLAGDRRARALKGLESGWQNVKTNETVGRRGFICSSLVPMLNETWTKV